MTYRTNEVGFQRGKDVGDVFALKHVIDFIADAIDVVAINHRNNRLDWTWVHLLKRDFIIEIGGDAGVRYRRRILRRAANNSEGRHMYPAHSLITVIKAGRFNRTTG